MEGWVKLNLRPECADTPRRHCRRAGSPGASRGRLAQILGPRSPSAPLQLGKPLWDAAAQVLQSQPERRPALRRRPPRVPRQRKASRACRLHGLLLARPLLLLLQSRTCPQPDCNDSHGGNGRALRAPSHRSPFRERPTASTSSAADVADGSIVSARATFIDSAACAASMSPVRVRSSSPRSEWSRLGSTTRYTEVVAPVKVRPSVST